MESGKRQVYRKLFSSWKINMASRVASGAWEILNSKTILDVKLALSRISVEGDADKHADTYYKWLSTNWLTASGTGATTVGVEMLHLSKLS